MWTNALVLFSTNTEWTIMNRGVIINIKALWYPIRSHTATNMHIYYSSFYSFSILISFLALEI